MLEVEAQAFLMLENVPHYAVFGCVLAFLQLASLKKYRKKRYERLVDG